MPSGNSLTVTTEIANRWKNSAINDVLISIYTHSPREFKLIHLMVISIRLGSTYVHIGPVVILKQSHSKYIYTPNGYVNMVIIEIHTLRPVAILI